MSKDNIFFLEEIRADLDREEWETVDDSGGEIQVRRSYLGSIFSLTPSGKYYLPFACSNVAGCDCCRGSGQVIARRYKRRVQKRHASRHARIMRRWEARYGSPTGIYGRPLTAHEATARAWILSQPTAFRQMYRGAFSPGSTCTACGGCGSREAHLDEVWREQAEAELESIGCSLENGEGDASDLFAVEYRDTPGPEGVEDTRTGKPIYWLERGDEP